jgi:hypothetical protein
MTGPAGLGTATFATFGLPPGTNGLSVRGSFGWVARSPIGTDGQLGGVTVRSGDGGADRVLPTGQPSDLVTRYAELVQRIGPGGDQPPAAFGGGDAAGFVENLGLPMGSSGAGSFGGSGSSSGNGLTESSSAGIDADLIERIVEAVERRVMDELERRGLRHRPEVF